MVSSREELRRGQTINKKGHVSFLSLLLSIIMMLVLMVCLLVNNTVLNKKFMADEISSSAVVGDVQNKINASLAEYGISNDVISTNATKKILRQTTEQVYDGKSIRVDSSSIIDNFESKTDEQLSQYGVNVNIPSGIMSGASDRLNNIINSQVNTPEVQKLEDQIKLGKMITTVGVIVSVIIIILVMIRNFFHHRMVINGSWMLLITGIIFAGIMVIIKPLTLSMVGSDQSITTIVNQILNDSLKIGWNMVIALFAGAVVLFCVNFFVNRRRT